MCICVGVWSLEILSLCQGSSNFKTATVNLHHSKEKTQTFKITSPLICHMEPENVGSPCFFHYRMWDQVRVPQHVQLKNTICCIDPATLSAKKPSRDNHDLAVSGSSLDKSGMVSMGVVTNGIRVEWLVDWDVDLDVPQNIRMFMIVLCFFLILWLQNVELNVILPPKHHQRSDNADNLDS